MTLATTNAQPHTPTPWKVEGDARICAVADGVHLSSTWARYVSEVREGGESWLDMRSRTQPQRDAAEAEVRANTAFIVRACNSHDELVRRACDVLEGLEDMELPGALPVRIEKLRAAIAKATGAA